MSQSTIPAPAPSSTAPVRKFAVVVAIEKDGKRNIYRLRPADTFPGSFFLTKNSDRTVYTVNLAPKACTCPGFAHAGHCKHADFLARFLPGLADVLDQADGLRRELATAQAALSVALADLDQERERVKQLGGLPADEVPPPPFSADDITRGDRVHYRRKGAQPEECTVERIKDGKARILRPSGRRLTVPLSRLSSLIPF
jgi:hypothetical protein